MTRSPEIDNPAPLSLDPLAPDEDGAYRFAPGEADIGARIDKWLSERIESLTRSRLKALIEEGALSRDGEAFTDPSWKMRAGETFALAPPPVVDPEPKGEAIPLDVLHEDADVVVLVKPAGLVVHPAAGNWSGTLVNALIHHCGDSLSGVGGVARPGIVHRLDKETSGVMVVAKHDAAHLGLTKDFSRHAIERVYDAICLGAPRPGVGTVDAALARGGGDRKKMAVVKEPERDDARRAVTHYKIVESFGRTRAKLPGDAVASLLACELETGRTHQIRAHMAHIGHPLIGDPVYGRGPGLAGVSADADDAAACAVKTARAFRRQALHARVLGFAHPISGEDLRFEAPPPADFDKLRAALAAL
ncbi:MAG: RluA family pseudouridine synthase [Pseudomonadota bacterium]